MQAVQPTSHSMPVTVPLGGVATVHAPHPTSHVCCVSLGKLSSRVLVSASGSSISARTVSNVFQASHTAVAAGGVGVCDELAMDGQRGAAAWLAAYNAEPPASSHGASASAGGGLTIHVSGGLITALTVVALPGGVKALGVVGTTAGTLVAFLIAGGHEADHRSSSSSTHRNAALQLTIVCELRLSDHFPITGTVRGVCLGMDPAGRPEFVAASTRTTVMVLDVMTLGGEEVATSVRTATAATPSWWEGSLPVVRRDCSAPFCAPFAKAEVVKILAPQRAHAAFAMDIALVVVLADSTLHYVTRAVSGGSVQLLHAYHEERQAIGSAHLAEISGVGPRAVSDLHMEAALAANQTQAIREGLLTAPRAAAHVHYAYRLSPILVTVSQTVPTSAAPGSTAVGRGYNDMGVVVNDATFYYHAAGGRMDLILCGSCTAPSTSASHAHWLAAPVKAWWAILEGAVLPAHTLSSFPAKEAAYGEGPWTGHPSALGMRVVTGLVGLRSHPPPLPAAGGGGASGCTFTGVSRAAVMSAAAARSSDCFAAIVPLRDGNGGMAAVLASGVRLFLLSMASSGSATVSLISSFDALIEDMANLGGARDGDAGAELVCSTGSSLSLVRMAATR